MYQRTSFNIYKLSIFALLKIMFLFDSYSQHASFIVMDSPLFQKAVLIFQNLTFVLYSDCLIFYGTSGIT